MSHPNTGNVDPSTGQFVDPLFAIFIAAAVSETIVPWTKGVTEGITTFSVLVVTLGFINLLLSWFGYHKSVIKKPIRGSLRFIVTVVLLPLYMLSIIMYTSSFLTIVAIYSCIFFLWSCWECLRNIEHGEKVSFFTVLFRPYNILMYATLLLLFSVSYIPDSYQDTWCVVNSELVAFSLLTISIIWLRLSKSAGNAESPVAKIKDEITNLLFGVRD